VDYGALEMVTLAQICLWLFKQSSMADAINAGKDLHIDLAADFVGNSYGEMLALKKAKDKQTLNLRQMAKIGNFGLAGGMGAPKLVASARSQDARFCELAGVSAKCSENKRINRWYDRPIPPVCCECVKIAVEIRKAYLKKWKEMRRYLDLAGQIAEDCSNGIPLESLSEGNMKRLEPKYAACANHYFQHHAAVGAKDALWRLAKECYTDDGSVLYGNCYPVLFIHDEIICEVREEVAHECALRQTEVMVKAMQKHCPDVKVSAEPALMRRWFKGAEAAWDKNKRLKPWWPPVEKWDWAPDQEQMRKDMER
jgi:hypothetical protein